MVALGILLSRVLGFARNIILANRLGDSPAADAYEAAFIIPDFLNYLLAGGFLAITFVPILSRFQAKADSEGAKDAFNAVLAPVAVLIIGLTGAAFLSAETIVGWLFGSGDRMDGAQLGEVVRLTRLVLPAQICFVLGGLFTAVQYAHGRFVIPTLAPIIYNLGIIVGGLLGGSAGFPTASGFIVGAVVGAALGNLALQWWGATRIGFRVRPRLPDFRNPVFREYLILALPLMVGQSIVVIDESLGKVVVSAASDGSVFGLNLARRVNMVPVGVIAQAAGVASFPYLARLVAEDRTRDMHLLLGRTIRSVLFVSGAAVAVLLAVSQPVVRVAFQHGAFSENGTVLTAAALVGYSLSIPAWGLHQILARSFYALSRMWVPVIAGTAWTLPAIPGYFLGYRLFGVTGVALASSFVISGHALTMWIMWRRSYGNEGLEGLGASTVRLVLGTAVAGSAGWLVAWWITAGQVTDLGTAVVASLAGCLVVGIVYLATTLIAGSPEARALARLRR